MRSDWHELFAVEGARWFHTGGVFAALSETTPGVIAEAIAAARAAGTTVSYDLNYRPSLWKALGGFEAARAVNRDLVRNVDVLIGNEEDFTACLGLDVAGVDERLTGLDPSAFEAMIEEATAQFPNLKVVATTLREVRSASRNDWSAVAWSAEEGFVHATPRRDLEILDRVGGGDSFVAGLAYALLSGMTLQDGVEWGAAHGALAMTTPGDTSTATLDEVRSLVGGGGARVRR